jgi:hypothetical protein
MASFTLTLSPTWGGTTFGPFAEGSIQLGSDGQRCQITLGSELGVHPVHAVVWPGPSGTYGLQQGAQGAQVFLYKAGNDRPFLVTSPVEANAGDSFSLVSAEGPRFEIGIPVIQAGAQPGHNIGTPGMLPSSSAMGREVQRQIASKLGAGPLAGFNQFFHKVKSGQLMQPRYILAGVVAVVMGCVGIIGAVFALN